VASGTLSFVLYREDRSMPEIPYAKALEHAANVFGCQQLAEDWLRKPCTYLDDQVPLALIDNPPGFQVVEDYLARIELGVYQ
jgi:putative toxin-antitoxin system antitoxin component (TIGR02293 family)